MENKAKNRYLIIGAGGTGGNIAAMMSKAGKDVILIARDKHLEAIKSRGMTQIIEKANGTERTQTIPVNALSACEYVSSGKCPDVIFICTKSYSIEEIAPFVNTVADSHTIIISVLNGIGMEQYIRLFIHTGRIVTGCLYIYGTKDDSGSIRIQGNFIRIVFGPESGFANEGIGEDCGKISQSEITGSGNDLHDDDNENCYGKVTRSELADIEKDLMESNILARATDDILTESIRKFSYTIPVSGTMLYFDSVIGQIREQPEQLDFFKEMVNETERLGIALGAKFAVPLVDENLRGLEIMSYDSTTSLVRDVRSGHKSEFETLIKRPAELGKNLGIAMPHFDSVISKIEHR